MNILIACAVTVIVETFFFWLNRYRKAEQLAVIACANVVTNLTLNLLLVYVLPATPLVIILLELAVLAAEYCCYALAFGRSGKLFMLTLIANLITFALSPLMNYLSSLI